MGRTANEKLADVWRGQVRQQERSGLSIRKYCRREGVSEGNFYYWRRRLREMGTTHDRRPAAKRNGRSGPQPEMRSAGSGFVQVAWTPSQAIEVCFVDGTVLKLPVQLDALALTLQALRAAASEGRARD
jgi:hypothetical protein